jgi:hypothetical protein
MLSIFALMGAWHFTKRWIWPPIYGFWRFALRPRKDLKKAYGGNWAVVTGASYGIGESYCYELARQGFNIVLMARSIDRMNEIAMILETKYGV